MPLDNSLGGAGAAPGSYTIFDQYPDTLIGINGKAVDGQTVEAVVDVYQVWFQVTVSQASWDLAAGIAAAGAGAAGATTAATQIVGSYAAVIEAFALLDPVTDIYYQRDVNSRSLFIDQLVVTVGTQGVAPGSAIAVVALDPAQETAGNNTILATWAGVQKVAAAT